MPQHLTSEMCSTQCDFLTEELVAENSPSGRKEKERKENQERRSHLSKTAVI